MNKILNKHKLSMFALSVITGMICVNKPSEAANCAITQDCVMAIDRAKSSINSNIDDMDSNISKQVNRARVDIIEALARETTSLSGQQAKAAEVESRHQEELTRAEMKMAERRSRAKPSCGSASGTVGPAGGGGVSARSAGRASANSAVPERLKRAWDHADPSAPVLPPANPDISKVDLGVGSCQGFAGDANSARGHLCRQVSGLRINSNPYADADIKAETLFEGPQRTNAEKNQMTVTAKENTPERDARKAIVRQYSSPLSPPGISASAASTPEGVAYIGAWTAYNAMNSLASKPARDWDSLTSASKETIDALKVLVADEVTGKFVSDHLSRSFPNWQTEGVSPVELAYLEAEKRVGNPDWAIYMAGADEIEKAAEIPLILAYQQRIMFQQLQETRRQNVLLGQVLSMQIKEIMLPEIERLARSANKRPAQFDNDPQGN